MRVYGYLRASTNDQDAGRARADLEGFAGSKGLRVAAWFEENESGATLNRPQLFRLLEVAQSGDVLLVEQVDRISRLREADWRKLSQIITEKGIRVVALDLPTSHRLAGEDADDFTEWMLKAINAMMLEMLAAVTRKDYEDRRRRQSQGIAKARASGKYRGRPIDQNKHQAIAKMLGEGWSYGQIQKALGASRTTISRVKKRLSAMAPVKGAH